MTDATVLLDMVPFGIIVLDAGAKILFANACASEFLSGGSTLYSEDGVLLVRSAPHRRFLSEALRAFSRGEAVAPVGFNIERPDQRPISLVLTRLPGRKPCDGRSRARARVALILSDPDFDDPPTISLVRDLFQLTPTESSIAILIMRSMDTAAVARELGITGNTLRDHLKSMFLKTHTRNQRELLHTLLRSPLLVRFKTNT